MDQGLPRRLVRVTTSTSNGITTTTTTSSSGSSSSSSSAASSSSTSFFAQPSVREIHKNAWLRRINSGEGRLGGVVALKRGGDKWWVVFCVHDDCEAWLEFYADPKSAVIHRPAQALCLNTTLHVSPALVGAEEFAVTLPTQVVRLLAHSWEQVIEWVESLQGKLRDMNILGPKDNVYSKPPTSVCQYQQLTHPHLHALKSSSSSSSRDPNSPLPLLPPPLPPPPHGDERVRRRGRPPEEHNNRLPEANSNGGDELVAYDVFTLSSDTALSLSLMDEEQRRRSNASLPSPNVNPSSSSSENGVHNIRSGILSIDEMNGEGGTSSSSNVYEHVFVPRRQVISNSTMLTSPSGPPPPPQRNSDLIDMEMQQPLSLSDPPPRPPHQNGQQKSGGGEVMATGSSHQNMRSREERTDGFGGTSNSNSNCPGHSSQEDEPLEGLVAIENGEYRIVRREDDNVGAVNNHASLPLKEAQVLRLETEMRHSAGVKLVLKKKDIVTSMALVDYEGGVWVAGWKQRQHPVLYYAFHMGDLVMSVCGIRVGSVYETLQIIRRTSSPHIEVIVRRLPYGRVWVLKRSREGEPLGLVAEGGSGEISEVLTGGLAWRQGVCSSGPRGTNWYLTEINNRPLSLFSKGNQVKDRLNAVGREISILVQPATLVKHLRRSLKQLNGYKDYVVG